MQDISSLEKESHFLLRNGVNFLSPISVSSYVVNTIYSTISSASTTAEQEQSTPATQSSSITSYIADKVASFSANYLETLTKEQVDTFLNKSLGFSAYYGLVPVLGDMSSFAGRAEVSMGFKLYNAIVNPLTAQFVESFTDVHANNAKFMYYTGTCLISGENCEARDALKNPFRIPDFNEKASVLEDFMQFDLKRYVTEASDNLDAINIKSLLTGGILSATAGDIKDVVYDQVGLTPYMQGYLAKNWINFYVKDFIKAQLHSELNSIKDKMHNVLGLNEVLPDVPQSQSAPISMSDVVTPINTGDIITNTTMISIPLMDITQLQAPLHVVTAEILG